MNFYRLHEGHAQEPDPDDDPFPPESLDTEEPAAPKIGRGLVVFSTLALATLIILGVFWVSQHVVLTYDPKEAATAEARLNPNAPSSVQTLPPDICLAGLSEMPVFIQFGDAYLLSGSGVSITYLSKSGQFVFIATDATGSIVKTERWQGYPCPQ